MKNIDLVLKELFPSEEMASYLSKCTLDEHDIVDMVGGAPIPLERKRELLLLLAEGEGNSAFSLAAEKVSQAIQEMQPKQGEFFYLISYQYNGSNHRPDEKALEPFLSWEHIFERIQEYLEGEAYDENLTWFCVEKWTPDGTGRLKNNYDFDIIGEEVCYFYCYNDRSYSVISPFSCYCNDPNLPLPFKAGDIVTLDCRPFAPVSQVVILKVGDNIDCCCLQALFRESDGTWNMGAVKHKYVFPNRYDSRLSPLYRLSSFEGPFPEEERLLEKVSRYLNGDEGRGEDLWNYILSLQKGERKATGEKILSYIEGDGKSWTRMRKNCK